MQSLWQERFDRTFPLLHPVTSSGTPSESRSKLFIAIAWFLDCKYTHRQVCITYKAFNKSK